ncbi:exocyst complex component Sec10 [Cystobasidium minutum MCA 4210]|uniref:exocyst complex component Sec10 n=1 Tax=Cystobasidium minutum MCA 4210 TaxID=1397322 RepID=UPI0034CDC5DC|eukprot:jgi/Rhomi1/151312/estExt_Genewise1.C_3_t20094
MAYDYSQHAGASNNNSYNPGRTSGNSLAVPTPSRPYAGSRKGSHASGASVDLTDGDGYYADKGIAELDADVPLELDTFQAPDFNVGRLVSSLTDSLIAESKQGGGAFDPTAFIGALEQAVDELIPLRKDVARQTQHAEKQVEAAERQYSSKVKELRDNFNAVNNGFQNLETRITEVGRTTVRVGDELETLDRLRTRAAEARDIITYYYDFAKGDLSSLEALRKEGRVGRTKLAGVLRRLANVAREIEDVEDGEATRDAIDKYCEKFETDMLKHFDRYYQRGDPTMMAHCAKVLLDFNGGQSCVQVYVNQHDFFITRSRIADSGAITASPIWDTLPDPDAPAPHSEPGLSALYDEIRVTVGQEGKIITAVFPNPYIVMQSFLQRVFAQVIQAQIESLIEAASSSSTLAFLRVIYLARSSTNALVEDVKGLDFFKSASSGPAGSNATADQQALAGVSVLSGNTSTLGSGTASSTLILDLALAELFSPYLDKYIDREQKSLTELYAGCLVKFTRWHRIHSKTKTSGSNMFDRMVDKITTAAQNANVSDKASSAASAVQNEGARGLKQLMKLSGINTNEKSRDSNELQSPSIKSPSSGGLRDSSNGNTAMGDDLLNLTDEDGQISLATAERMFRWHAEAVGRMLELSPASDAPKNAFALLRVLGDSFGQGYLETALDTAISLVTSADGKTQPPIDSLKVIREVDLAVQLWQRYVSTAILPLAGSSLAMRREMSAYNAGSMTRIENRINELEQKMTDAITSWLSTLLSRQKKMDFKPKADANLFETERTEPCAACCNFMLRVREVVLASLSGKNQEGLLTDIGIIFHGLLLEHFKKFPVGDLGTILLTKDLAAYQDAMSTFSIPIITERFEMLRQLGKLFEVQVEVLGSFLDAENLRKVDRKLLRPYIQLRADYDKYPKKTFDQVFGDDKTAYRR